MLNQDISSAFLRSQIVGVDSMVETPFGERMMVYCDYTASGRSLHFVENYLVALQRNYANTHTEDDVTGRSMTRLLHTAEDVIKRAVNAGPDGRIVAAGTGATAAIDKLQQILGIACPPATRRRIAEALQSDPGGASSAFLDEWQRTQSPVVFVGPYEHHSNEISWRQGLARVVEVDLAADGGIDLAHLERLLAAPEYRERLKIGSFSAASNVSGRLSPVREIARLLHRHGALACFDYAACAPYVDIDMNPPGDGAGNAAIDAIFVSPHKFLGGPGSCGILVFNKNLYPAELPPTVAGGGTVDYVGPDDQDFIADIEEREKAGTPGVLQAIKAALAFEIRNAVGVAAIESREQALLRRALGPWQAEPRLEILGNPDPERRIAIVSFNARDSRGRYLHPKFITALLNDLFGIQSRAGCSCAGPYGHRLLHIGRERSEQYRRCVAQGYGGLKPGWCRVGFHYTMDDLEADYVIEAVRFVARYGHRFLSAYDFDLHTGAWQHKDDPGKLPELSLADAVGCGPQRPTALPAERREELYAGYLQLARDHAERLASESPSDDHDRRLEGALNELQFFALDRRSIS